jgi:hypothetical protein
VSRRKRTRTGAIEVVRDDARFRIAKGPCWLWLESKAPPGYEISGKYLFFSPDVVQLERIAENEIVNYGFHHAKWSTVPMAGYGNFAAT